ncbi:MAG: GNAT family N-acetyltransferase [Elusimicrobiota bacterium]|jgi:GNAT superfamily N-acetyltransferase
MNPSKIKLVRLDRRRLGDFEHLLSNKEFGGCFCARWRSAQEEGWAESCKDKKQENLEATRRHIQEGGHAGFLIVRDNDGAVVGWTGSGPKTSFPLMKDRPGSRLGPFEDSVWAVGCIAMAYAYRGLGYAQETVSLLVEEARKAGASSLEACPIEGGEETCAWRGTKGMYEGLGFSVAGKEEDKGRTVLRMERKLA